jgi:DNA-binding CsgD family transcriptional regulator
LQLLLARHQSEIIARQEQIVRGWERLDTVLAAAIENRSITRSEIDPRAEVITDHMTIARLSVELYQAARTELLGITLGTAEVPISEYNLVTPPDTAAARGARFRMIYDTVFAGDRVGSRIIDASITAGEEARVRADLPLKMLHVDDSVALLALSATGMDGALLIRSPQLLAALRQWFELLWDDPATTAVGEPTADPLTPAQRQVLRLLSTGMNDEAVARASNASVRTVRRHITAILDILGVKSRFAAGAMAAKKGWI